jgi:hypothetical protein
MQQGFPGVPTPEDAQVMWFSDVLLGPDSIEPALLVAKNADLVGVMLTSPVHGIGLAASSSWISSPTAPFQHEGAWVQNTQTRLVYLDTSEGTLLDILADAYGSLACGVASARDGTIRIIQWTAPTIADSADVFVSLNSAPRMQTAWKMRRDRTIARPGYRLTSRYLQAAAGSAFSGDVVALSTRAGNVSTDSMGSRDIAPFVAMSAAGNAWSSASAYYGTGATVLATNQGAATVTTTGTSFATGDFAWQARSRKVVKSWWPTRTWAAACMASASSGVLTCQTRPRSRAGGAGRLRMR